MNRYDLQHKTLKMLAENRQEYGRLQIPCSRKLYESHILPLEKKIQEAFKAGYQAVVELPELVLFQWMAKINLGTLYNDVLFGQQQQVLTGEEFSLSWLLKQKFSNLHSMFCSLFLNMEFKVTPWSIVVVPVAYSQDIFNYRDEPKNLNFSLGMHNFGIVACLQDNGHNRAYHQTLLRLCSGQSLHAIQFEELCARFIYSNYLLRQSSAYLFEPVDDTIVVQSLEGDHDGEFAPWDDKTYSQVLANYWSPWGFTSQEIYSFPDSPVSYLMDDYTNQFIPREKISQPG